MEIIETFSILFDCLSFSLEQNKQINYSQDPVPNESAIGIILNKLPTYKGYLKKKIKSDYRERRCWLSKKQNPVVNKSGFENTIKKLIALAELSSQYFARYQRAFIRSSLSKTRKWIFKAIAHLEKEKKTCMINMRSSSENYSEKLKEFMNDFSWKRFFHYLKILSQGVAKVSEKKLSKSAKEKIEDFFKHPVKVSRLVCIENLYLSEISHKKVTTRLSNHSKSLDDVKDLFSSFLTLQNTSSSVVEGKKRFKHQTILSRSMISHLSSPHWKPLTLHFYLEPKGLLKSLLNCDSELSIKDLKKTSTSFELLLEESEVKIDLSLATLQSLLTNQDIFSIDVSRFLRRGQTRVRQITELERSELQRIYTSVNSPVLHPSIIPEADQDNFNYEYIIVNNSLQSRSSTASRNWLVQLEKSTEKITDQAICAYPGCLSAKLQSPVDFKLAELPKTRKKLKKVTGNDFCRLHQCINLLNRNKKTSLPAFELWSAIQAGLLWRGSIKPSSILGKVLGSQALEIISKTLNFRQLSIEFYKSDHQVKLEKTIADPEACAKLKEVLLEEVELLKHEKQYETAASEELRKIFEGFTSLNQSLVNEIKHAMSLSAYEKFCVLSRVREKVVRMSVCDVSRNYSNRSSRPPSAAKDKQKEDTGKRKSDLKLLPSPYLNPYDKNPSFRLKQLAQPSKVPKSKSFALLEM